MPNPTTRGLPRDWRVGKQSPASTRQFHRRAILNEQKPCDCPGCNRQRIGVSRYCKPHKETASDRGDPVAHTPRANELIILRKAVSLYLATVSKEAARIWQDLAALDRRMYQPPSFRLRYADIHRGLPQVAKARGLLANWLHTHRGSGRDRRLNRYADAVINALAVEAWVAIYYSGLWGNRRKFLETQAGNVVGHINMTVAGKTRTKRMSGAVHRHLGRNFVRHAHEVFGSHFWTRPVITEAGTSLSLLDYSRLALRAAGLLDRP